jgi:hypothetical protein
VTPTLPPLTEKEFQKRVTDYAVWAGWKFVHFRPAQTSKGWRTPVEGPLGAGWPDLILIHEKDRRLIFAEIKSDNGKVFPAQELVHAVLLKLAYAGVVVRSGKEWAVPSIALHVWRPRDWPEIVATLGGSQEKVA